MLTFISIVLVVYGLLAIFSKDLSNQSGKPIVLPLGLVSVISGILLFSTVSLLTKIGPQDVGVQVTPTGVSNKILSTGWHFVAPWVNIREMSKTERVYTFSNKKTEGNKSFADAVWAPTKDGIKVGFDVSISWKIDDKYANWLYANISGTDDSSESRYLWIEENLVRSKTISNLSLSVSEFTPVEAYSNKREQIQVMLFNRLSTEFVKKHLVLMQVNIREVFYNPEYEKAINAKKLAEQEVLRLEEVTRQKTEKLKQAEIDKNIVIQTAEGEAKALQIKGNSIKSSPQVIQLNWIEKWDGKLPQYMLSGSSTQMLMNIK